MDDDLGSGLLETIESTSPSVRYSMYFLVSIYLIYLLVLYSRYFLVSIYLIYLLVLPYGTVLSR